MSEEEKAQQIGVAVSELQVAKVERSHLEQKLERVLASYREAAKRLDKENYGRGVEITDGKVTFGGWSSAKPNDLMNESELAQFLLEFQASQIRVKKAIKVTQSLGITSVK